MVIFNAHVNNIDITPVRRFGKELVKFCSDESFVLSDVILCNYGDIFTYFSESHNTVSWLNHAMSTFGAHDIIKQVSVCYNFVSSDHLPVCINLNLTKISIDTNSDINNTHNSSRLGYHKDRSLDPRNTPCTRNH